MKLIFDLTKTQPLGDSKFHGGGKYGEIVFKALIERSNDIIAYYFSTLWINPYVAELCEKFNITVIDAKEHSLNDVVEKYRGVIYSPILENKLESIGSNTYICTIHGLRTLEMPFDKFISKYKYDKLSTFYSLYAYWKARMIYKQELKRYRSVCMKKNVYIVTVSEHSKASLLSFIPKLKRQDVKVFYSPSTSQYCENNADLTINTIQKKYYLLISADRWIKNSHRAVKAFDELFTDFPSLEGEVVLTGVKNPNIFKRNLNNPSRFKFLNYLAEEELLILYKNAYLFVYPSLNEGFGYPPLEAMAQGTPVIASAVSSIPEVCGDAVLYFNPYLVNEIKMRILQMENNDVRELYVKKGFDRFRVIEEKQNLDLNLFVTYLLSFIQ